MTLLKRLITCLFLIILTLNVANASVKPSEHYSIGHPIHFNKADVRCLAENIYFEARDDSYDGQFAVGQVTLNRLKAHKWGNTICQVVFKRYQFSWTNYRNRKIREKDAWQKALDISDRMLYDSVRMPFLEHRDVLYYHEKRIRKPYWTKDMLYVGRIGKHLFYQD